MNTYHYSYIAIELIRVGNLMYQCGDENVTRYESFQKVKSKGDKIGHGYDLSRVWRTRQKWDWSGSREIDDHHLGGCV